MSNNRTIIFSILEYLRELAAEQAAGTLSDFGELDAESLSVAIDCLSSTFGVDTTDAEQRRLYAQPTKLRQLFAERPGSSPENENETDAKVDPKFDSYLQLLSKRGYFDGVAPGSDGYAARLREAKARYQKAAQQKGEATSSAAQPLPSGTAESWKLKGNEFLLASPPQPREAIDAYSKAIQLDASNAIFYANRAAAHILLHDYRSAVDDCKQAIAVQPAYIKSYARLGQAYEALGEFDRAIAEAYEPALQVEPDNAVFTAKLAELRGRATAPAPANPFAQPCHDDDNDDDAGDAAPAGMPDLAGLKGLFPDGKPDIGSLLSDPSKLQQIMSNPAVAQMMQNPQMMQMAQQFMQNPSMLQGLFGSK